MSLLNDNKKSLMILLSIFIMLFFQNLAFGEPEYDAQGELIAVGAEKSHGVIDQITPHNDGTGFILINDIPYRVTSETKYLTSYNSTSSLQAFSIGQVVGFYRIDSVIIKMWPEKDDEEAAPQRITPSKKSRDKSIKKEKGVWKN